MNLKLILQLSAFGLIMAFATVSLIPENIEPVFWVIIFIFCALVIARACTTKFFWNGFVLSLVNSIWITAVHAVFYKSYMEHHPNMAAFNMGTHPRLVMVSIAPVFGAVSGLIQGLFAFIASKLVSPKAA